MEITQNRGHAYLASLLILLLPLGLSLDRVVVLRELGLSVLFNDLLVIGDPGLLLLLFTCQSSSKQVISDWNAVLHVVRAITQAA